ncbi:RBR-type E3 ubiquitin transferase [Trichonephila clavipes]|nr:RBR-type E3 ubiquitin transferase [Trichonephila clavipes]
MDKITIPDLNGTNYFIWELKMKAALSLKRLDSLILNEKPEDLTRKDEMDCITKNSDAIAYIKLSLADEQALSNGFLEQRCRSFAVVTSRWMTSQKRRLSVNTKNSETLASSSSGIQKILELIFFATAIEKNVQQTVAAAMTIVTTCNFTFRSHPPLSRKPRLSIYTGDVLVTSSTVMLRTLKNGTAALGNHSFTVRGGRQRESAVG